MAAFLTNSLEHFYHKCLMKYISAFNFAHEIVQTKTKKLEINLNIEFGRAVLSTVSVNKKKIWNDPLMQSMLEKAVQKSSHSVWFSHPS